MYVLSHISTASTTCSIYVYMYVTRSGKRYIPMQKLKMDLLASKKSAELVLSNDAIVTLVAASVFAP